MKGQPCAFTLHSDNPRCWPARASTSDPRGSPGPCLLRLNPVSHPCDTVTLPALWWTPAPPSLPWGLFLLRSPPPILLLRPSFVLAQSPYPIILLHFLCPYHHSKRLISWLLLFPRPLELSLQEVGTLSVCSSAPSLRPRTGLVSRARLLEGGVERRTRAWSCYYPRVPVDENSGLLTLGPMLLPIFSQCSHLLPPQPQGCVCVLCVYGCVLGGSE